MVTDVMTAANAGVAWLMQTCAAFYSAKERTVRAIKQAIRSREIDSATRGCGLQSESESTLETCNCTKMSSIVKPFKPN